MKAQLLHWLDQFGFFEFIGYITCGLMLSNYYLGQPFLGIGTFISYLLIGLSLLMMKYILRYRKFATHKDIL
jgi:hypothetical protein